VFQQWDWDVYLSSVEGIGVSSSFSSSFFYYWICSLSLSNGRLEVLGGWYFV
jgi:hypothetical protein